MWVILQSLLTLLIHMVIILPVFAIGKELYPIPEIDSFFVTILPYFQIPATREYVFIAELTSLLLSVSLLWSFVFPYFPVTLWIQRALLGQEKPNEEEQKKLNEILSYFEEKTNIDPKKYKYFIQRTPIPNALASGLKDISITSGMFHTFSTPELVGVIAHEMGHHVHKDTIFMNIANGITMLSFLFQIILCFCVRVLNLLRFLPFIGLIFLAFALLISLFLIAFHFLIFLPYRIIHLFFNRQVEYNADSYAVKIGLGEELAEGLYRLFVLCGDSPWWKIPWLDHPRLKNRIKTIHKQIYKTKTTKNILFHLTSNNLKTNIL